MNESWTEIRVEVPVEFVDRAGDIAHMTVPYGIYIEDYSDLEAGAREIAHIDLIDEALLQKDRSKAIVHIYIEAGENPMEAVRRTGSTTGSGISSPSRWARSC